MSFTARLHDKATIAGGGTDAVLPLGDLRGRSLFRLFVSGAFAGDTLTFYERDTGIASGVAGDNDWRPLYQADGTQVQCTGVVAGSFIAVNIALCPRNGDLKLVSNTAQASETPCEIHFYCAEVS